MGKGMGERYYDGKRQEPGRLQTSQNHLNHLVWKVVKVNYENVQHVIVEPESQPVNSVCHTPYSCHIPRSQELTWWMTAKTKNESGILLNSKSPLKGCTSALMVSHSWIFSRTLEVVDWAFDNRQAHSNGHESLIPCLVWGYLPISVMLPAVRENIYSNK